MVKSLWNNLKQYLLGALIGIAALLGLLFAARSRPAPPPEFDDQEHVDRQLELNQTREEIANEYQEVKQRLDQRAQTPIIPPAPSRAHDAWNNSREN